MSVARLGAELAAVVCGLVAGAVSARWLGPAGKGTLASLLFLSLLLADAAALGLGDSLIILVGRKKLSLQEAVSNSLAIVMIAAPIAIVGFIGVSFLQFGDAWSTLDRTIFLAATGIPLAAAIGTLTGALNAREEIPYTSSVFAVTAAVTAALTVLFIIFLGLDVAGGVAATIGAYVVSFGLLSRRLTRLGISLRPRLRLDVAKAALRHGVVIQASYLMLALSQRVDQLIVYGQAGRASGGHYSVALTLGQLVGYAPFALSMASFPRAAYIDDDEVVPFITLLSRTGLAAATTAAVVLGLAVPWVTPLIFGSAYRPAVAPALVLLLGGIFWCEQWLLCRVAAARGQTELLFASFGVSVVLMVVLDLILIPAFGVMGAAAASVAGTIAGAVVCLVWFKRRGPSAFKLAQLIPRRSDFKFLFSFVASFGRAEHPGS